MAKVDRVYVFKGKKVTHFDLRATAVDQQTLLDALLGPTGNLRAPALLVGKTLIVGFNAEEFPRLLG